MGLGEWLQDNWKMTIGSIVVVMILGGILASGGSFNTLLSNADTGDLPEECLITVEHPASGEKVVFESISEYKNFVESNSGSWEAAQQATNPEMRSGFVINGEEC